MRLLEVKRAAGVGAGRGDSLVRQLDREAQSDVVGRICLGSRQCIRCSGEDNLFGGVCPPSPFAPKHGSVDMSECQAAFGHSVVGAPGLCLNRRRPQSGFPSTLRVQGTGYTRSGPLVLRRQQLRSARGLSLQQHSHLLRRSLQPARKRTRVSAALLGRGSHACSSSLCFAAPASVADAASPAAAAGAAAVPGAGVPTAVGAGASLAASASGDVGAHQYSPPPGDEEEHGVEQRTSGDGASYGAGESPFFATLRLVETAMLSASAGLAFFLANNLRIESYFGFFFPLPAVICSVRWGPLGGLRCVMATALLLFVLSGPLKALTFLLLHGFVGATLGLCWRLRWPWAVSVPLGAVVRASGAVGFVLVSSWLIQENILRLILMNLQAGIALLFSNAGLSGVPSMQLIYTIFGSLLIFNCAAFSLLVHLIYSLFLKRLGMESAVRIPPWLDPTFGK